LHSQFDTEQRLKPLTFLSLSCIAIKIRSCHSNSAQEVYNAARSPKTFLEINGQCHEEASIIAPDNYRVALRGFLSEIQEGNLPAEVNERRTGTRILY